MPEKFIPLIITVVIVAGLLAAYVLYLKHKTKQEKKKSNKNSSITINEYNGNSELSENYLLNFREDRFGGAGGFSISSDEYYSTIDDSSDEDGSIVVSGGNDSVKRASHNVKTKPKPKMRRVPVKPIDVIDELQTSPTNWSLGDLDGKIAMLKDKADLITQKYAKQEVEALICCLENRKKYNDSDQVGQTNREYFSQFDQTDEAKVNILLKKYNDLKMGQADIFIPEFPDDATKIMKEYTEKVVEISGKKPILYVIAQKKDFKKADSKRDPILLAQSPFGFHYFILGAWDKEMLYLPEL